MSPACVLALLGIIIFGLLSVSCLHALLCYRILKKGKQ